MKTHRDIYSHEAADIIRNINMYRAMTKQQILAFYPEKQTVVEKLLSYLVKEGRMNRDWEMGGIFRCLADTGSEIDRGMMAAVWVLCDFVAKVEFHSVSDFPTKIMFLANNQLYEIVYVESGREALINSLLAKPGKVPSKYFMIVENEEQIPLLEIPNVAGYCTVSPDGEVQYYQEE